MYVYVNSIQNMPIILVQILQFEPISLKYLNQTMLKHYMNIDWSIILVCKSFHFVLNFDDNFIWHLQIPIVGCTMILTHFRPSVRFFEQSLRVRCLLIAWRKLILTQNWSSIKVTKGIWPAKSIGMLRGLLWRLHSFGQNRCNVGWINPRILDYVWNFEFIRAYMG